MCLLGLLCAVQGASARDSQCHIHPPGSTPENPVNIVGPFPDPATCERERQRRFGAAGRCHCRADFTPDWLPQDESGSTQTDPRDLM